LHSGGFIFNLKVSRLFAPWLIACFVLLFPASVLSQQATIRVYGNITENNKKLPGAVVSLYANGSLLTSVTSSGGKYELTLELGVDYMVTYTKPGFITKRIEFNTKNVPADRAKNPFSDFPIDIDLFPEIPGTDIDKVLMQPIGKIAYDKDYDKVGDFVSDDAYHQSIQSLLDKIEQARKDAEEKSKEIDAQYKKIIAKADGEYTSKNYTDAKTDYLAASQLKTGEQYPKDQLAAIDKAIKANGDAAKAAADAAKKAQQQKTADSLAAIKKAADAKAAADAAKKAQQQKTADSLAAVKKANDAKAAADAAKKAQQQKTADSLAAVKKAQQQRTADSIAAAKKAADAKAAADAAKKAQQQKTADSLAAIKKANDAKAAADAAKKAQQQRTADSLAAIKKANDAKAAADAAKKTQQQRTADSLAALKKSQQQRTADSLAAAKKAADAKALADAAKKAQQQKTADSLAAIKKANDAKVAADAAKKAQQQRTADSLAALKKSQQQRTADSLAALKKANDAKALADAAKKAQQQKTADSLAAIKKANDTKAAADAAKKAQQQRTADSLAALKKSQQQRTADSLAAIKKANSAKAAAEAAKKAQQQRTADSLAALKKSQQQRTADSLAAAKKAADAKAAADALKKAQQQKTADSLAAIKKANDAKSMAANAAKRAIQNRYDSIIKIADAAFNKKEYVKAKSAYGNALKVKSDEQYPTDQIALIDKTIADAKALAAQRAQQTKYDSLIKIADAAFKVKSWDNAKAAYTNASTVKPDEQYPKDQLAAITRLNVKPKTTETVSPAYMAAINKATQLFVTKNYKEALTAYQQASAIAPNEDLPKQQIAKIKDILATQAANKAPSDTASGKDSIAMKYPPGVTEEHIDEPGCEVTRRIVVKGNHGWIFTRKVWSWGQTYYFKGDQPITNDAWNVETTTSN
jgi:hypothetical protein